jgi:HAD superfamily hydrolase (TIGR01509 family)
MRYQGVIFDLDGLLLDTERLAVASGIEALADLGHPGVEERLMRSLIGLDLPAAIARLRGELGATLDAEVLRRRWDDAMDRMLLTGVPTRPGAAALIDWLAGRGVPFAVATNSRTARACHKLDHSELAGRVGTVVGFDLVVAGKPAPDVYLEAARRLGIRPDLALAFEDSDTGAAAALAAGMTVVQVPDLVESRTRRAHYTARSLAEGARLAGLRPDAA